MSDQNDTSQDDTSVQVRQLFLKISGDECPQLVTQPASKDSCPANLVLLPGCLIESCEEMDETGAWEAADKVADMCRSGLETQRKTPQRNALCEHLAYAYSILCDYVMEFDDDYTMSKETAETLIRGAIDRIVSAGKCVGFELDKYRSED